jgi:peptide-methionine (S)-S-oxide reductase
VCTGLTGHTEVVLAVYDPNVVSFARLLEIFWQSHDPTQGMRQGADIGTQYRSGVYTFDDEQLDEAEQSRDRYQKQLAAQRFPKITTEILAAPPFYYAEDYHQQYLAKNPSGYCGIGGCGIAYSAAASSATAL